MKYPILFLLTIIFSNTVCTQVYDVGGQGLMYFNNGNVGIGITNPERAIHIQDANGVFRIDRDRQSPGFIISEWTTGFSEVKKSFLFSVRSSGINDGYFEISDYGTSLSGLSTPRLVISNSGNVGIGTTNPLSKLSINGKVESTEVQVKATIADYVFKDGYKLKTIQELEDFINSYGHLPGVYSENDQIKNRGLIPLGEVSMNMLEKIEELTLYIIQLNNQNLVLKQKITDLEEKLSLISK